MSWYDKQITSNCYRMNGHQAYNVKHVVYVLFIFLQFLNSFCISIFIKAAYQQWYAYHSLKNHDPKHWCTSHYTTRSHSHMAIALRVKTKPLDSGLPGCDTVSLGQWFPTFRRNVVPPSSMVSVSKNTLLGFFEK